MTLILTALLGLTSTASAQEWYGEPTICDIYPEACVFDRYTDLTITDVRVGCDDLDTAVFVTVQNLGIVSASAYVDVWFGEASPPAMGEWGELYEYVYLPGFGTKVVILDIDHRGESGWVDVIIDTDEYVDESDEGNNSDYIWGSVPEVCIH